MSQIPFTNYPEEMAELKEGYKKADAADIENRAGMLVGSVRDVIRLLQAALAKPEYAECQFPPDWLLCDCECKLDELDILCTELVMRSPDFTKYADKPSTAVVA